MGARGVSPYNGALPARRPASITLAVIVSAAATVLHLRSAPDGTRGVSHGTRDVLDGARDAPDGARDARRGIANDEEEVTR
jgi:hypothetical protein